MEHWFERATAGDDPMAPLVREVDWAATSLGAPRGWPSALRSAVEMCLSTRFPVLVTWGPELLMIYNDGYREMLGASKHPSQGRPLLEVWQEIAPTITPWLDQVLTTGVPYAQQDTPLVVDRSGFEEETYFTFCYSALRDDDGACAGVLNLVTETTEQVVTSRRLGLLSTLTTRLAGTVTDVTALGQAVVDVLGRHDQDLLAVELAVRDGDDLLLLSTTHPRRGGLVPHADLHAAVEAGTPRTVGDLLVAPLVGAGDERPDGVVVLRPNPARPLDGAYREFLDLVVGALATAVATTVRHTRELGELRHVSSTLQLSMLPGLTGVPGAVGRYLPAVGHLAVGGDWYDAAALSGGRVGLVVGDCVGHGLGAAAVMGQLRSAARALLLEDHGPAATLRSLDRFAGGLPGAECTTVFCAVVDPAAGTLTYSAAGHPPVLVAGATGPRWLDGARSLPLAVVEDVERTDAVEPLVAGESLVLFTDGLVERVGEGLEVGLARLERAVAELVATTDAGEPLDGPADALLDRLLPDGGRDDVALLLFRTAPVPAVPGLTAR